jgi:TolB-like protein
MDAATVQKFGRIQGVQGLVMGRVSSVSKYGDDDVKLRFSVQVFEVETGKLLWGAEKVTYGRRTDDGSIDWSRFGEKQYMRYGLIGLACVVGIVVLARVAKAFSTASRPR